MQDYVRRLQALPKVIRPGDLGQPVAFLDSDEAKTTTGAEISVDAGM